MATLLIYGVLSILRHSDQPIWDEARYLEYARNLTHGFYVTDEEPNFVNGPGYPIVLMPFCESASAALGARLLNAFFMAGAVGFVWLTVRHYAGAAWAFAGAALTGFHPTLLWMGFALMSEPMSTFTLTGFVWSFAHALRDRRWSWTLAAVLFLGWLILTRVFFGHVLMATAVLCLALLIIKEWRPALGRALVILAGAFLFCTPYLAYTQAKTGQFLCWSTNSGELLYWMSSHHEGENGHWFGKADVRSLPEVAPLHDAFYQDVLKHPILEREEMLKAAALANFKANPARVGYNWVCNLSRLAFGFPRSHQPEELRTILLIGFNGPVIFMAIIAGVMGAWYWRTVPVEVWILMGFAAFYLGGSTLAPSLPRYFVLMIPILWLGIAQVWSRHLKVTVTA
ncbi:ArnT family glycosyltransferase [Prosthecobacter fusiformis]|uniref:ArnT family glycosyltransferase n=1 Tax=Prosthecobacter fusiformis TaxID=48464 RepID=UPI001414F009|nr:glycosyltransferase family 39 protein [Prosthecobacter fusiformis]